MCIYNKTRSIVWLIKYECYIYLYCLCNSIIYNYIPYKATI